MGATTDGDVAVIVGSSTCHLAQSREGVFGSARPAVTPTRPSGSLHPRGRPDRDRLDPRLVSPPLRRFPAARGPRARCRTSSKCSTNRPLPCRRARDGLVVRDDWQGNRSPYKNPQARGAIAGLSLAHGPGHLFRAIYEATACGTRHILEDAKPHGLNVERIFLGGGGARSALWLQIHADIIKKPIHLAREREACALRSAMAGSLAAAFTATSTRPPAPWSPSNESWNPSLPMRACMTNCLGVTSNCISGSIRCHGNIHELWRLRLLLTSIALHL